MGYDGRRNDEVPKGDTVSGRDPEYYQAHKDDEDEWGPGERAPARQRRRLAAMVSVRFSPEEAERVRQAARERNESLSTFVRRAALERCGDDQATVGVSGSGVSHSTSKTETPGGVRDFSSVHGHWTADDSYSVRLVS
jgi:hypothetical protein